MDDLDIAGTTQEAVRDFKQQITSTNYDCKDLGELHGIFNMEVTHTVEGSLFLSQFLCQGYVREV